MWLPNLRLCFPSSEKSTDLALHNAVSPAANYDSGSSVFRRGNNPNTRVDLPQTHLIQPSYYLTGLCGCQFALRKILASANSLGACYSTLGWPLDRAFRRP